MNSLFSGVSTTCLARLTFLFRHLSARKAGMAAVAGMLLLATSPSSATTVTVAACPWAKPINVTSMTVQVWGGGGGGGGNNTTSDGGGGGGGGGYATGTYNTTSAAANIACLIGTAGAGGVGTGNAVAGGESYFVNNTTVRAAGGSQGVRPIGGNAGAGGTGGAGTAGTAPFYTGGSGGAGNNSTSGRGGGGGSSAGTGANGGAGGTATGGGGGLVGAAGTEPTEGGVGGVGGNLNLNGNAPASGNGGGGGGSGDSNAGSKTGGNGAAGKIVVIYRTDQAITFNAAPTVVVGSTGTGTVSATGGGSGNPVTFTSTTPSQCTHGGTNGATITGVAAGTNNCIIAANQAADAGPTNWNAAPQVTQTFSIGQGPQATLNVTAPASVTYGSTGTLTSSGGSGTGAVTYSSGGSTGCSVADTTLSITNMAGTCDVTATKAADANYLVATSASFPVTLSVASQTITFGAQAAQNYSPSGTFAISPLATASSGLAVTYNSTTLGVCTVTGTTVTIVTGGTCTIAVDQGGNINYAAAPQVTQNITINPANQTITFGAQAAQTYAPSGTFAISPVATATSGLTVAYTSTTLSVCTVAGSTVTIVTAGTCTIAADQGGNTSYNAAPQVTQNVSINPGAANKLAFFQQPTNTTVDALFPLTITVQIQDFYGNLVTSDGRTVTLSHACGAAQFGGSPSVTAVAGVATFSDLSLDDIVSACQLTAASSPALTTALSTSFNITFLPASKLVFASQPNNEGPATTMSPAITVEIQNASGQVVAASTASVAIAIGTNPGGGTLTGTTPVTAVAGVATFSNLSINNVGNGYTLTATDPLAVLTPATSNAFNIVATTDSFSSSNSWVAPPGVYAVTVEAWGGGGAGGSATGNPAKGGGGAGGQYAKSVAVPVTPGSSYGYSVGAGGNGGAGAGPSGGDTTFDVLPTVRAKGGAGGASATANNGTALGGVGSTAGGVGGTVYRGGSGSNGVGATQPTGVGGAGGGGAGSTGNGGDANPAANTAGTGTTIGGGSGAAARTTSGTCTTGATIAGGGGCGGYALSGTNRNGGSGARGRIDITYVPATELANGTNPANVTLAPGAGITDLDAFTLVTSTTTDSVTALTVTLTGANSSDALSEVRITSSDGLTTYFTAVTNPGSNTINFSGGTPITATTTATTYKVRITPKTHANMPLPPGVSYAVVGTVTAFTSSRAQILGDSASATVTIDNLSPASATGTSGSAGNTSVTLNWTTSASPDFSRSVMLRWAAASVGFEVPVEGTDYANGNAIGAATVVCVRTADAASFAVTGAVDGTGTGGCSAVALTNGQAYSYRLFQKDSNGNYDQGTTVGTFTPAGLVATKLVFFDQPSNTAAGSPISPAFTVQIQNASSAVVTSDTRTVSLAKSCGGNFGGTTSVAAVLGVATFSNVSIDTVAPGCILTASSSPVLTPATSTAFDITAASLCFSDDFNRASFLPSANWTRTKGAGTFFDANIVNNRLRLTDNTPYNVITNPGEATAVHLQRLFPGAGNKVTAEFDYFAYNGDGADGLVITLSNASIAPVAGAFGGSLGYAQKCQGGVSGCTSDCAVVGGCPGFAGGWIGVGLDEFGNYSNPTEGRIGGLAALNDSVAIRGSGSGQSGYNYHTRAGTGGIDSTVVQTGTNAAPGHRYRIIVDHSDGLHAMTSVDRDTSGVRDVNGDSLPANYTPIIVAYDAKAIATQAAVPPNWFFSFSASTGGSNNIHEIDNLKVCTAQPMVIPVLDHVRIIHDGAALTCAPETITLKACENAACTAVYTGTVTVNLNAIAGATWSLSNPVTITGGQIQLTLTKATTGTVTLGGATTAPTPSVSVTCYKGSTSGDCSLTYSSAACAFDAVETRTPVRNPPGRLYTKVAGTAFTADILALNAGAIDAAYLGTVTVDLVDMNGVASGSCGTTQLATTTPASPYTQTHTYTAGNAGRWTTANFSYPNAVKEVSIRMVSGATTVCSDRFTIRPYSFSISSPTLATNPAATSASIFKSGAALFTLDATAGNASAVTTTTYSTNALIHANRLEAHASAIQNNGTLSGSFLANTAGVSRGTAFTYSEVGNFRFKPWGVTDAGSIFAGVDYDVGECFTDDGSISPPDPNVADPTKDYQYGCYFGNTAASSYFGRFVPNHFETVVTGPMTCGALTFTPATACPAGGLVYSGQPFTTKVTAYTYGGTGVSGITMNYDTVAAYSKTVTLSAWDAVGSSTANPPSNGGAMSSNTVLPASFFSGVATATLTPLYTFTVKPTAPTNIYIRAIDTDNVTSLNPIAASSVEGGVKVVSGRLRLTNALGSERLPLVVPVEVQFYNGTNWLTNAQDSSSTGAWSVSPAGSNLLVGTGATGSTSGTLGTPLVLGVTTLTASAPGTGGFGYRDLTVVVPDYLKFAWTGAGAISPTSRVSFGIYKGNNRIIYRRERY